MSVLFSPFHLRDLTLPNRIVVSPMCQYSADEGCATDWHMMHLGSLALSGAAMLCIEATAVEAVGRITPGCLGLYDDATEAALKPVLAAIRKHSKIAVAMQLAHAGRKASSQRPWEGGQQIPLADGGWMSFGPSAVAHKDGELAPRALDDAGLHRIRDAFVASARRALRLGIEAFEIHAAHGDGCARVLALAHAAASSSSGRLSMAASFFKAASRRWRFSRLDGWKSRL